MPRLLKPQLDKVSGYLKSDGRLEPSLDDVVTLAAITAETLEAVYARLDRDLHAEVVAIAEFIGTARREIAALGAGELERERLPSAGEDLGAIVRATEDATHAIMAEAEGLLALDAADPAAMQAQVADAALRIFEHCTFQDLTGQRIRKVVDTLGLVEKRLKRFAVAMGVPDAVEDDADEAARARRAAELILNGPQARGAAMEQDDIDAILFGDKAG